MSIYKDCDIRGIYEKEFDASTAYRIGRSVGSIMGGKTLAVGGDVRVSTPVLKHELIRGLLDSGANVADLGMIPTPVLYFAMKHYSFHGGVTVTASHNPAKYNGFKLMFGERPVTPADIAEIKRRAETGDFAESCGVLTELDTREAYIQSLASHFPRGRLRVVIDCGNGAMSELAPHVFEKLGYDVQRLYCAFDGRFPNRPPNPAVYENLRDLCAAVLRHKADIGIGFDGDGDRVVFVDDAGQVVTSEQSLVVLIDHREVKENFSVVYDQKSSSIVKNAITAKGGIPLMERSGHAFIKKRFLDNHSVLAGEISGHFFFGELGYDDGLFAALRMCEAMGNEKESLSTIRERIPQFPITPDIRVFCPYEEQDRWLEQVRSLGRKYAVTEMDGIRVELPQGWLLARKSVTEEGMTFRMEAADEEGLKFIKGLLCHTLPQIEKHI